jgi:hypothetical protein
MTELESLAPGTLLNGYRVEHELGRGAMAVVYLATQLDLRRPVALKVLSAEQAQDGDFVSRFLNEARSAAALSHPNIIQAIDAGVTPEGIYYFCMEYVEGETLLDMIHREGALPPAKLLPWAQEIAGALRYGYRYQKFTHGDIKPENIMVDKHGTAKLADFGLSRVEGHDFTGKDLMLTPLYAAPELIRGERVPGDCRADIYAFGATLYHGLAGTPPFPGEVAQEVLNRHLNEEMEPLNVRNPSVPKAYSDFIGHLLSKDVTERIQGWDAVIAGLSRLEERSTKEGKARAKGGGIKLKGGAASRASATKDFSRSGRGGLSPITWMVIVLVLVCALAVFLGFALGKKVMQSAASATNDGTQGVVIKVVEEEEPKKTPASTTDPKATSEKTAEKIPASEKPVERPQELDVGEDKVKGEPAKSQVEEKVTEDVPAEESVLGFALGDGEREEILWIEAALAWYELCNRQDGVMFVSKWLSEHGESQGGGRQFMEFVQSELLPQYAQLIPGLVSRKAKLIESGEIQGRDGKSYLIHDMSDKGVVLDMLEKQNRIRRPMMGWNNLVRLGIFDAMCQRGYAKEDFASSRPYLAYAALIASPEFYQKALGEAGYSSASGASSGWGNVHRMKTMLPSQGAYRRESEAFRSYERLVKSLEAGSVQDSYRELVQLQGVRDSGLVKVLQNELVRLNGELNPKSIAGLAKSLLDEAESKLGSDNAAALRKLMLAVNRYGLSKRYPERESERLLKECLDNLAREVGERNTWAMTVIGLGPNLNNSVQPLHEGYARMRLFLPKKRDMYGGRLIFEDALETANRLAFGDWAYAWQNKDELLKVNLQSGQHISIFPYGGLPLYISLRYASCLLEVRFTGEFEESDKMMQELCATIRESLSKMNFDNPGEWKRAYNDRVVLAYTYWLLTRRAPSVPVPEYWKAGKSEVVLGNGFNQRRLLYLNSACQLERGDVAGLLRQYGELEPSELERLYSMNVRFAEEFQGLLKSAQPGEEPMFPKQIDQQLIVDQLRLALACVGERDLGNEFDGRFRQLVEPRGHWFPQLGGDVIYCWLLRRVGNELSKGNLAGASSLVDWALDLDFACMFPYYARLNYIKSGLLMLDGKGGDVADISILVSASSCSSEAERQLLPIVLGESKQTLGSLKLSQAHELRFWHSWLRACLTGNGLDQVSKNHAKALPFSERTFLKGSVDFEASKKSRE